MPEPVRSGQRYLPGLDGLRALAVLAVVAFHEQLGWAPGGLLGVGVFFTLSGYLITDLLLGRWAADGRLHLGDFWLRRARRLLPALMVMLLAVAAWVTIADRSQLAGLRPALGAAGGYASNWYLIAQHSSYFAQFAPPAPLDHLWSLAVEEQFYLAWPWLLLLGLGCLTWTRRRRGGGLPWLALPTLALAAFSALAMVRFYQPGLDPTRVYEGTDTRAFGLLAGAALAMVWPTRRPADPDRRTRLLVDGAGLAGLAVIALLVWRVGQYSPFIYRGGLVVLSLATAGVVAAAVCPGSVTGRALGWRPLRWLGVRSYGIYLWHFPVIVLTTPRNSPEDLPRAAAQVTASVLLAALSWKLVEEPVRHGALGRLWRQLRTPAWWTAPAGLRGWAVVACLSGVTVVACAGLSGTYPSGSGTASPSAAGAAGRHGHQGAGTSTPSAAAGTAPAGTAPAGAPAADGPLRTSCRSVAHIGDSTSDGLNSPDYLPHRSQRIPARYHAVGVRTVHLDISGARSIVETLPGRVNGYDAARALVREGFHGCWVIVLGTDDTADVVVGSEISLATRIRRMMSVAAGEPVMWVNVKTVLTSGPYAESSMLAWNRALLQACARYPNMRIFDWASVVRRHWFISDGVHYTSPGYAARARLIATALAKAFPAAGESAGCLVR